MVHPPPGPVPLHVIVEVSRHHGRGRTQKAPVAPKGLLQESRIVLLQIALAGVLRPDTEQVKGRAHTGQPVDRHRRHPVQAAVMAVPAELEAGRAEPGQEEPLVRIPADPDEGRFGQRGSPVEKPSRLGRFGDHREVRAQRHQRIDLAMQRHRTVPRDYAQCSLPIPRPEWGSSSASKGGMTPTVALPASATCRRPTSRGATDKPLVIQTMNSPRNGPTQQSIGGRSER